MTRVLIAGGGTVGLSTALFLAHHGVQALVVERSDGPSAHPRATGLGFRTLEFFRQAGIADAVEAVAVRRTAASLGKIYAPTLATADLPDTPPAVPNSPNAAASRHSPSVLRGTCPQDRLDSVLLTAARERGAPSVPATWSRPTAAAARCGPRSASARPARARSGSPCSTSCSAPT